MKNTNFRRAQLYYTEPSHLDQDIVVLGDLVGQIRKQREVASTKTTYLALSLHPLQVREHRVDAAPDQFAVDLLKLGSRLAESNDLGRADESPIQGVEEEHDILARVVAERNLLDSTTDDGVRLERGSWLLDLDGKSQPRMQLHTRKIKTLEHG
jgi:hypothetical protein